MLQLAYNIFTSLFDFRGGRLVFLGHRIGYLAECFGF